VVRETTGRTEVRRNLDARGGGDVLHLPNGVGLREHRRGSRLPLHRLDSFAGEERDADDLPAGDAEQRHAVGIGADTVRRAGVVLKGRPDGVEEAEECPDVLATVLVARYRTRAMA
jgi:hypothetical protein